MLGYRYTHSNVIQSTSCSLITMIHISGCITESKGCICINTVPRCVADVAISRLPSNTNRIFLIRQMSCGFGCSSCCGSVSRRISKTVRKLNTQHRNNFQNSCITMYVFAYFLKVAVVPVKY